LHLANKHVFENFDSDVDGIVWITGDQVISQWSWGFPRVCAVVGFFLTFPPVLYFQFVFLIFFNVFLVFEIFHIFCVLVIFSSLILKMNCPYLSLITKTCIDYMPPALWFCHWIFIID